MPATYAYIKEWRRKKLIEDPTYRTREHRKYRQKYRDRELLRAKVYREINGEKIRQKANEATKEIRYRVLSAYSNGLEIACVKCGFKDIKALQIDHINNNGAEDRRTNGKCQSLFRRLIKNNFPIGYQVLCANCNTIKEMERR